QLSASTRVIALTENRREDIRVSWSSVENAQFYTVKLYAGANNTDPLAQPIYEAQMHTSTSLETNIDSRQHHTVGITAISERYTTSEETRVSVLPRTLQASSFDSRASTQTLILSWSSNSALDDDFYAKTNLASLLISVENTSETVVTRAMEVSTTANTYSYSTVRLSGGNYVLKIALRATSNAVSLDGEALSIPFRVLQAPTDQQIKWTADHNTITVRWLASPTAATSYALTLEGTSQSATVNARTAGSVTFSSLEPGMTYQLNVVSSSDNNLYLASSAFSVEISTLDLKQLVQASLALSIERQIDIVARWLPVNSATAYVVSLHVDDDTQDRIGEAVTVQGTTHTFENLTPETKYAVKLVAQADGFEASEAVAKMMTPLFVLPQAMSRTIMLLPATNSIAVRWSSSAPFVQTYLISISPDTARAEQKTIAVSAGEYTFKELLHNTGYAISIVSSRDETGYALSSVYREPTRTTRLPQLPMLSLEPLTVTGLGITASWNDLAQATTYLVSLYHATAETALGTLVQKDVTNTMTYTFGVSNPLTTHTITVSAIGDDYRESEPAMASVFIDKAYLPRPTEEQIILAVTTKSISVSFANMATGVDGYNVELYEEANDISTREEGTLVAAFSELEVDTSYILTVSATGDETVYIESLAYSTAIKTSPIVITEQLFTPRMTTATKQETMIEASWEAVENALSYTVLLYSGLNEEAKLLRETTSIFSTNHSFALRPATEINGHNTVGVIANMTDKHLASTETRVAVLPSTLLAKSFSLERGVNTLSVRWVSDSTLDNDFYSKTMGAVLLMSIENTEEDEVVASAIVGREDDLYSAFSLTSGTEYNLNIVLRMTADGIPLDGAALTISFQTLENLLEPTRDQFSWIEGSSSATVNWSTAPENATSYEITLEGTIHSETVAITSNTVTFEGLESQTIYMLSIVAKSNDAEYLPSPPYRAELITTAPNKLNRPYISLSLESSVDIIASWDAVESATSYQVDLLLGSNTNGAPLSSMTITEGTVARFDEQQFGTLYTVSVVAQGGESMTNSTGRHTIITEYFILPAPANNGITLSPMGVASVAVRWSPSNPMEEAQVYHLSIEPDPNKAGVQAIAISENEYIFSELSTDTTYTVSVASSRDETGYVLSSIYQQTTRTLPITQLDKPSVSGLSATARSITLNWLATENAKSYAVKLHRASDMSVNRQQASTVGTSYTFEELDPGVAYALTVQAQAKNYTASELAMISGSTLQSRLPAPLEEQIDLTATSNSLTMSWRNTLPEVNAYRIDINPP
ncbi:MAG: fibronectin type III domain-containing protein, partial [Candidatus Oxydemutatoraceae bacterium WSBS_2016_MAG_OTU14]